MKTDSDRLDELIRLERARNRMFMSKDEASMDRLNELVERISDNFAAIEYTRKFSNMQVLTRTMQLILDIQDIYIQMYYYNKYKGVIEHIVKDIEYSKDLQQNELSKFMDFKQAYARWQQLKPESNIMLHQYKEHQIYNLINFEIDAQVARNTAHTELEKLKEESIYASSILKTTAKYYKIKTFHEPATNAELLEEFNNLIRNCIIGVGVGLIGIIVFYLLEIKGLFFWIVLLIALSCLVIYYLCKKELIQINESVENQRKPIVDQANSQINTIEAKKDFFLSAFKRENKEFRDVSYQIEELIDMLK